MLCQLTPVKKGIGKQLIGVWTLMILGELGLMFPDNFKLRNLVDNL